MGRQLKQSVNVFHNFILYLLLPIQKKRKKCLELLNIVYYRRLKAFKMKTESRECETSQFHTPGFKSRSSLHSS